MPKDKFSLQMLKTLIPHGNHRKPHTKGNAKIMHNNTLANKIQSWRDLVKKPTN